MKIPRVQGPVVAAFLFASVGAALAAARGTVATPAAATPSSVDFNRDIQPILAGTCVRCHGPRKTEADLRLDTHAGLLKGGEAGAVVVAGDAEGSRLYQLLVEKDPDKRMPRRKPPLSTAQIE